MPVSRPKPPRHLNYDAVHRILTLKVGAEVFRYSLAPTPSDAGMAYRVNKLAGYGIVVDTYTVTLSAGDVVACTCKGFARWNRECKHIAALLALRDRGLLPTNE